MLLGLVFHFHAERLSGPGLRAGDDGPVDGRPDAFKAAVEDLTEFSRRWPTVVPKLITQRFAPEKFADVLLGKSSGIKNVIQFSA